MRKLAEIVDRQHPLMLPMKTPVTDACRQMRARRVDTVLVTDEQQRLAGIFTDRDACQLLAVHTPTNSTSLADVMQANPDSMTPEMSVIDALRLMWDGGIGHLPVVKDATVLGVVSSDDFATSEKERFHRERYLWERLR